MLEQIQLSIDGGQEASALPCEENAKLANGDSQAVAIESWLQASIKLAQLANQKEASMDAALSCAVKDLFGEHGGFYPATFAEGYEIKRYLHKRVDMAMRLLNKLAVATFQYHGITFEIGDQWEEYLPERDNDLSDFKLLDIWEAMKSFYTPEKALELACQQAANKLKRAFVDRCNAEMVFKNGFTIIESYQPSEQKRKSDFRRCGESVFDQIFNSLETAAQATSNNVLREAVDMMRADRRHHNEFESGQAFGKKKSAMWYQLFNEKVKWFIRQDMAEAINLFITEYGNANH